MKYNFQVNSEFCAISQRAITEFVMSGSWTQWAYFWQYRFKTLKNI